MRRQRYERDVVRDGKRASGVPAGLVKQDDGMGAGVGHRRDLGEVEAHGLGVAAGQDEGGTLALGRAGGAEQIGRRRALVLGRRGAAAAPRPAPGDAILLPDLGFVLEPHLYPLARADVCRDRRQCRGEVFLNVASVAASCW